jgi:hypothetical protein
VYDDIVPGVALINSRGAVFWEVEERANKIPNGRSSLHCLLHGETLAVEKSDGEIPLSVQQTPASCRSPMMDFVL